LESDVRRAWQEWCQGRTPSPPAAAAAAAAATTTETFTEDATASTSGAAGTTAAAAAPTAAAESTSSTTSYPPPQLDVLVCNAGVLLNDLENTSEGVETTFACHLLFGTYLLGSLAKPSLEATKESRLVVVSE
jgi:NAD(P)-dependent dehydrogenase (short-subunit alcohol dehydrogenase family)